jgi:hypothetical protein
VTVFFSLCVFAVVDDNEDGGTVEQPLLPRARTIKAGAPGRWALHSFIPPGVCLFICFSHLLSSFLFFFRSCNSFFLFLFSRIFVFVLLLVSLAHFFFFFTLASFRQCLVHTLFFAVISPWFFFVVGGGGVGVLLRFRT